MLNKKIKIFITSLIFFIIILTNRNYAKSQNLISLDFDVKLKNNGEADIVETWNILADDTNTLFKTFEYDSNKFKNINVFDVTDNIAYNQIYDLQYHVDPKCFYALENKDGLFEIAWNIGADNTRKNKTYKISYTVEDAVKLNNDCAEFYWKFISDTSAIPAKNITGRIKIPSKIENIDEDFRVWGHGPLIGEIQKISEDTAEFKLTKLDINTMMEIRITTIPEIFENIEYNSGIDRLNSIIEEETVWANEANNKRMKYKNNMDRQETNIKIASIITTVFSIIIFLRLNKIIIDKPKIEPTKRFNYYRNIPDENATPGEVEFIYKLGEKFDTSKVISATILNLALKKYIDFEEIPKEKDGVKINLHFENESLLEAEEKDVFKYLKEAAQGSNWLKLESLKKYGKKHNDSAYLLWNSIRPAAVKRNIEKMKYNSKYPKSKVKYHNLNLLLGMVGGFFAILGMFTKVALLVTFMNIINIIFSTIIISRLDGFSQEAIDEKEKLIALKKFLEDFSLLDEKDIPDLNMWEKYLVYATIFGISDRVIQNLKIKFPKLQNDNYLMDNYSFIYYNDRYDVGRYMERSVYSGYSSHKINEGFKSFVSDFGSFSSGSGGGGGFSSGGGGRFWWRQHGRKINKKEISKLLSMKIKY